MSAALYAHGARLEYEGSRRAPTFDDPAPRAPAPQAPRTAAEHFYFGWRFNVAAGGVDLKMAAYLLGACLLHLNVLSASWLCVVRDGTASAPVLAHAGCATWFVLDYLGHERAHLYTYDIFAERCGAKLFWGCLAFYPYFYAVGAWALVLHGSAPAAGGGGAFASGVGIGVFLLGYVLSRGANNQKHWLKVAAHAPRRRGGGHVKRRRRCRAGGRPGGRSGSRTSPRSGGGA